MCTETYDCINIISLENQFKKSPLAFFRQSFGIGLPAPDLNSRIWPSDFHSSLSSDTVQAKTFWSSSRISFWVSSIIHLILSLILKLLVFMLSSLPFPIPFPTCKGTFIALSDVLGCMVDTRWAYTVQAICHIALRGMRMVGIKKKTPSQSFWSDAFL